MGVSLLGESSEIYGRLVKPVMKTQSEFRPGFRISAMDVGILMAGLV